MGRDLLRIERLLVDDGNNVQIRVDRSVQVGNSACQVRRLSYSLHNEVFNRSAILRMHGLYGL